MINFTIIIPTLSHNPPSKKAVELCVASLHETVPEVPIIVASNTGEPESLNLPESNKITRIHVWEQGQCKGTNAAIATVNTEWVMVSNEDMIYPPKWLERLETELKKTDSWCVSPNLVEPRKGAPPFIRHVCGGLDNFKPEKFLEFVEKHNDTKIESGFNLPYLIKKELWDLIGGYDVAMDPWGSNSDSCLQAKIHLAGCETKRLRNCLVYHFGGISNTFHPKYREYWNHNWHYFIKKWGFERVSSPDVWFSQNLIQYDKLKFHPWWEGFYNEKKKKKTKS